VRKWQEINGMLTGQNVFLLGGGTSLIGFDRSKLDTAYVIAINHSIEHFPQAQSMIFGDKIFLSKTMFDLKTYPGKIFVSEKCIRSRPIDEMWENDNLYIFEDRRDEPTQNFKRGLFHPTSSGLLALNLAIQMKAKKIFLLGYDYYKDGGQMHFYEDYPHHKKYEESKLISKLKKFKYFDQWESRIINCNPISRIDDFKKASLEEVFGQTCYTGAERVEGPATQERQTV